MAEVADLQQTYIQQRIEKIRERLEKAKQEQKNPSTEKELLRKLQLQNQAEALRLKLQSGFASWAKWVASIWLGFILLLLIVIGVFNGFGINLYPNSVLITLLATTTFNVIALSAIIIKGLFPSNKE